MDGLFEILIILAIFLLPALEGMIKKRKQGGAGQEEGSPRAEGGERAGRAGPAPGRERAEAGTRSSEDRSAEELLPEDLWAVLTGQKRPEPEAPEEPSSASLERGEPVGGDAAGSAPGGADLGGMMSGEEAPSAREATTNRGAPTTREASYGYDVGGYGADVEAYTYGSADAQRAEGREAPEPTEPTRSDVLREIGAGMDETVGAGAGGLARARSPGTSGLRRSRASELQRIRTGRMARRGGASAGKGGGLHPSFQGLDRAELRRAIVLQEVLAPPLALRDREVLGPPPGLQDM